MLSTYFWHCEGCVQTCNEHEEENKWPLTISLPAIERAAAIASVKSFEVTGFQNFFKAHGKVKWQSKLVTMQ